MRSRKRKPKIDRLPIFVVFEDGYLTRDIFDSSGELVCNAVLLFTSNEKARRYALKTEFAKAEIQKLSHDSEFEAFLRYVNVHDKIAVYVDPTSPTDFSKEGLVLVSRLLDRWDTRHERN